MAIETRAVEATPIDWVAEAMRQAASLKLRLDDPIVLAELGAKLDGALHGLDDFALVPASTVAARLIGATKPRSASQRGSGQRTVIVEGYLATGVQIVRAARSRDGARPVKVIAVAANPAGAAFVAAELGVPVVVLEP